MKWEPPITDEQWEALQSVQPGHLVEIVAGDERLRLSKYAEHDNYSVYLHFQLLSIEGRPRIKIPCDFAVGNLLKQQEIIRREVLKWIEEQSISEQLKLAVIGWICGNSDRN